MNYSETGGELLILVTIDKPLGKTYLVDGFGGGVLFLGDTELEIPHQQGGALLLRTSISRIGRLLRLPVPRPKDGSVCFLEWHNWNSDKMADEKVVSEPYVFRDVQAETVSEQE